MTWVRALVAAGLSMILPGAGHALIRDWVRAVVFAGVFVTSAMLILPTDQLAAAESMTAMMDVVAEETDTVSQFFLSFIVLFAAIDATFRAVGYSRSAAEGSDGSSCPECGKALDEDLEFCHWCTTRLEPAAPDEEEPASP